MMRRLAAGAPFGVLGLAAILLARDFPPIPGQVYGPALFPMSLGAGLLLCALLVALQASEPRPATRLPTIRGRIAALGAALAPLLVILGWDVLGWPLIAFGLSAALLLLVGTRLLPALLAGIGMAVLTWVIFAMLLRVPLPRGPLAFLPY